MYRRVLGLAGVLLIVGGCAASPKETVLNLDTTDRKWTSRKCVAARKEVYRFDERPLTRRVVRTVGNVALPFAGTATSMAMSASQNDEREDLNHKVRAACISDPLKGRPAKAAKAKATKGKRGV